MAAHRSAIAEDLDGDLVFLACSAFDLDYTGRENPAMSFTDIQDVRSNSKESCERHDLPSLAFEEDLVVNLEAHCSSL